MLARGHHVTIVAPEDTPLAAAAIRMTIPLIPTAIRQKRVTGLVSIHRWLAGAKLRTDVINTHSSTDSWLTALACAGLRNAPPVVRTRHVSTAVNANATTRWLYGRGAAHIVTTGEAIRRQLASQLRLPLDRLTSVPTGIDLARFIPGDRDAARQQLGLRRRCTLGSVATLRDWKGHDYLFEALALDRERWQDWDVIIVGDGPHRQKLEERVGGLGLSNIVRFVGQQENVVPWFQALDLFTLPSFGEEGVPQSIMQAMACSIPVVSTPVGAISEAVSHELTGLLVAARSPVALAQGLSRLRDDPACRTRFGAMGRARASRDFGIDKMLDRMEDVFYRVGAAK
jgi:glycosyltransferase involved in cell wall biosynthesis